MIWSLWIVSKTGLQSCFLACIEYLFVRNARTAIDGCFADDANPVHRYSYYDNSRRAIRNRRDGSFTAHITIFNLHFRGNGDPA